METVRFGSISSLLHALSNSRLAVCAYLRVTFLQVSSEFVIVSVESFIVGIGVIWEVLCKTGSKELLISKAVGAEEWLFWRWGSSNWTRSSRSLRILNLVEILAVIAGGVRGRRVCYFTILGMYS